MSDAIGTFLNARYQLEAVIGQGGMGVVYRAQDTLLERPVAAKVLSATELGTEGRARLLREARAAAGLNHPNIVSVYDAGEAQIPDRTDAADPVDPVGPVPFVVMELVEGPSLYEQPPAEMEQILAITQQICAALDHAHTNAIVHRDLKPENILLAPNPRVEAGVIAKLSDFGLARSMASRLTSEGTIVGTAFYLAPELALGQAYDGRADLYALGVMLYELTTGVLPFMGDDPLTVISQHLHAPAVPPRAKNAGVPPALDGLIVRLLAKAPEERPSSAAEVLKTLSAPDILDREAVPVQELPVLERIERGRLVGRERELAQTRAMWQKVAAGEGQTLLISGEPGIGKTRLVRELVTQVRVAGGRALEGACYAEGVGPYAPFAQILHRAFVSGDGNGFGLPDFVLADLLILSPALRLCYPDLPPNPALDPKAEQLRLFENVVAFCHALCERAPLLLVLEDAHWADGGTLALLHHLARRTRQQRLLLVATYREAELDGTRPFHEVLPDLSRQDLATRLKLSRLGREGTGDMLAALFAEEITPEFLEGIHRETEGNPFFIEEVCKALVESGQLFFEGGRWHRPSMEELGIPQSVRLAIQSRVGRLPPQVQDTLCLAAVLGREFEFETLLAASNPASGSGQGAGEEGLIDALESAERAQLIGELSSESGGTFGFTHGLIPATLAEGLSGLRRRRLHRRVAEVIEALHPDDGSWLAALAYHYDQAGVGDKALHYLTKAGDWAQASYANEDAIHYYSQALALVPDGERTARYALLLERERVHHRLGNREAQADDLELLATLAGGLDDPGGSAELALRQASYFEATGDYPAAIAAAQQVVALAGEAGRQECVVQAHLVWGQALRRRGDYELGRDHWAEALDLAMAADLPDFAAKSLGALALFEYDRGDYTAAQSFLEKGLAISRDTGDLQATGDMLNTLGTVAEAIGDYAAAQTALEQALRIYQEIGNRLGQGYVLNNLGQVTSNYGAYEEAQEYYQGSLAIFYEIANRLGQGAVLNNLGEIAHDQGDYGGARSYYEQALAAFREIGNRPTEGYALTGLGDALAGLGELDEAAAAYQQAIALRRELGQEVLAWTSQAGLAEVRLAQGELVEAQGHVDSILGHLETGGSLEEPLRIHLTCYRVLAASQDTRAAEILETAHHLLQEQAAAIPDEGARRSFLDNIPSHRQIVTLYKG